MFEFANLKVPIFSLNWQLRFFGSNLPKKSRYFQSKTDKIDTTIEETILNFWTRLAKECYLWSKRENVNINIDSAYSN